jgi:SanA protein
MTNTESDPRGRPWRWMGRLAKLLLGALACLATVVVGSNVVVRCVAGPFLYATASEVSAPMAIVPGASVHRDGTPSPQLEDRLQAALSLLRTGHVSRILVSGARNGAYDEAGPMRRWLTQRGVRGSIVLDDHAGFRTLDTMERAARVYGVKKAVVCTQTYHLPRAVFLARRAGIDAMGLAADAKAPHGSAGDTVRESMANVAAVIDSYLLRRQPREPGTAAPRD